MFNTFTLHNYSNGQDPNARELKWKLFDISSLATNIDHCPTLKLGSLTKALTVVKHLGDYMLDHPEIQWTDHSVQSYISQRF